MSGETVETSAVRDASRARIRGAARSLFAERGFAATRVSDIARRAGMSPANVYWNFPSKEAVLQAVLTSSMGNSPCPSRNVTRPGVTLPGWLRLIIFAIVRFCLETAV